MMRLSWDPSRFDVVSLLFVPCEEVALPVFRDFLRENCCICSCRHNYMGGGECRVFLHGHRGWEP